MADDREQRLLRILLHAYPDRVTVRRAQDPSRGVMVGGRGVVLEPSSIVRKAPLFLSIDPRDPEGGSGIESRVSLASAIEEEWLEEVFPSLLNREIVHRFDPDRGKVTTIRLTRFGGLVVREDVVGAQGHREGAAQALVAFFLANPSAFLALDEQAMRWLERARFLARHRPDLHIPEFAGNVPDDVVEEACKGCLSADQVRRRGIRRVLEGRLTRQQRKAIEEQAPETIEVPSGSRVRVQYPAGEGPPLLAVRLQEVFGWKETPRLAGGRIPLTLHLLGPNFRPVQITADLKSFWATTYAQVRKDLRARYPKHPWPEDPLTARPVSVGGRRKR